LAVRGLRIDVPPDLDCAYRPPSKWADAAWLVREGVPWVGRRANDLLPWAARMALTQSLPSGEGMRLRPKKPEELPPVLRT
jgi:hypothetical protein